MNLREEASRAGRRLAVPLAGFPGVRLAGETIRRAITLPSVHADALTRLADAVEPDALFTIMDLTIEAEALGIPVRTPEDGIPSVAGHPVKTVDDLSRLPEIDPRRDGRLPAFLETVSTLSRGLGIPVGGYVIGPFTLACELTGAQAFAEKTILDRGFVDAALDFTVRVGRAYARALADSGASLVAVLEPSAVFLSPRMFAGFLKDRLKALMDDITGGGAAPVLHICGDTASLLRDMAETGAEGLSLDAPVDMKAAAGAVPPGTVLIGNLDPVGLMMQGTGEEVAAAARGLLREMEGAANFILGSGCDLPPETPIANIRALVDAAKRWDSPPASGRVGE